MGLAKENLPKWVANFLSVVNLLIRLVGMLFLLGLLLLGCWIYYVYKYLWTLPIVLLSWGMVLLLHSVIEKWAVWRGHRRFIKYFAIINVIGSFSFIVGVQIFYFFAGSILKSELISLMQKYPDQKHARDVWSMIQSESCCGIYGPEDWKTIYPDLTLPRSCCTEINLNETLECIPKYAYPNGCICTMSEFIYSFKLFLFVATLLIFYTIRCISLFYDVIQSFKSTQRHKNPDLELLDTEERNNFINRIERNNFN